MMASFWRSIARSADCMDVIHFPEDTRPARWTRPVLALGNFDGVHRGHRKILDRVRRVLQHVKHHHGPDRLFGNWPGGAEVVNLHLLQAATSHVLDGLRHDVEAGHVVAEALEFEEVAPRADAPFHQDSRRRKVLLQQRRDQRPLGDVPPVAVLQLDQLLQVVMLHGSVAK